jgi:zinc/manganese transport system substrate-binding protein
MFLTRLRWGLAALVSLASVLGIATAAEAHLNVVATLPALAALTKEVGGSEVQITSLSYPNQDPHFVDARPNLLLPLNRADLLIVNGLELEVGWLPNLQTGARNGNIQMGTLGFLDVSTLVPLKQIPQQRIDRSMGDLHAGGNPHFLVDPRNGARIALGIANRLAQLDPQHAKTYRGRAQTFAQTLNAFAAKQTARFAALPKDHRQVIGYHQSWIYLLDWLGLTQIGMIEPKPGVPPTPGHVASLLGRMREVHVEAILQETYYPSRFGQLLAEKSGTALVLLPGGPNIDRGETYQQYLTTLTDKVYDALRRPH